MQKLLFILSIGLFFGCQRGPDYSDAPSITFSSIEHYQVPDGFNFIDSVVIAIDFQDGDGDLGLSQDDILDTEKYPDEFINNYFCTLFKKEGTDWNEVDVAFDSRFMRLLPEGVSPIDGTLRFNQTITTPLIPELSPSDSVRFEIYIVDRELNQSNTITTTPFVLGDGELVSN